MVVATACGQSAAQPTAAPTNPNAQLSVGTTADNEAVSPPRSADVATAFPLNAGVFETLVTISPTYQLEPLLATSWQFRAPNTYRFFLRHGVVFHNGQPFTAAAVYYTQQNIWGSYGNTLDLNQNSVQVVDDYTVDITPAHTDLRVLQALANPQAAYIVAPGTYPGAGTSSDNTPTGTGPFKFVSYTPNVSLTVGRFTRYWGPKAGVATIAFRFIPDDATRLLALQSGQVQFISDVPYADVGQLQNSGGQLRVVNSPVGSSYMIMLNSHGQAPYDQLNDLSVRQAVAYALDRSAIIAAAFSGHATPTQTYVVPAVLGSYANLIKGYSHDPAKAKQLLDAAGWAPGANGIRAKGGQPLSLTLIGLSNGISTTISQLVKAQLAAVGIDVNIALNSNNFISTQQHGAMNIALWQLNQNDANPTYQLRFLTSTDVAFFGVHYYAAGPQFEQFFADANANPDLNQARQLSAQALHVALDQQTAAAALAGTYQIWAMSKQVQNFQPLGAKSDQTWSSITMTTGG